MFSAKYEYRDPSQKIIDQELCESRGGRPGLPSLISLRFPTVDVKQQSTNIVVLVVADGLFGL